jgi:hypothetical protein
MAKYKRGSGVRTRTSKSGKKTYSWGGLKSAPKKAVKAVTRMIK